MFDAALFSAFGAVCIIALVALVRERRLRGAVALLQAGIAKQQRDGESLSKANELLIAAFDSTSEGVMIAGVDGAILRNRLAAEYTNGRHGEVLVDETCMTMLDLATRGSGGTQELIVFGPPNQVLTVRSEPLEMQGRGFGAAVFIRDITDRRHLDDVRTDFVANVSHELRTPIGALALLAETMVDETELTVMREFAERMVGEADRLARIVDDLLDLSRLDAGLPEDRTTEDVQTLVDDAIDLVAGAAIAASIAIQVREIPDDAQVVVTRRQVVSAIFNLLDNAVKYSDPGSTVDVGVEVVDSDVLISVSDHGDGIPTRDLDRIFERFYRVDRARSRGTGGTGLGLSIVRHIVESHFGDVTVVSHEGEGTTFTLRFPRVTRPANDIAVS